MALSIQLRCVREQGGRVAHLASIASGVIIGRFQQHIGTLQVTWVTALRVFKHLLTHFSVQVNIKSYAMIQEHDHAGQ